MTPRMRKTAGVCLLALTGWMASPVAAAVPAAINYQGRLTDNTPQHQPVQGTVSMHFAIWDSLTGGTSLWSETQAVDVAQGLFSVVLGSVTPITPAVFAGAERYLEITVGGETLAPRQRIVSAGFAQRAERAEDASALGGVDANGWQRRVSGVCPSGFAVNAVALDGTVTCVAAEASPLPKTCPVGQVAVSTGPFSWACSIPCTYPFKDCNSSPDDGCEVNPASNPNQCGDCGIVCSGNHIPNRTCSNYVCNGACAAGWADCNTNKQTDGCETPTAENTDNCGGCGLVCSSDHMANVSCLNGICSGGCTQGYADCNQNRQTDGCEIDIRTDPNNCGTCGRICAPGLSCVNFSCV